MLTVLLPSPAPLPWSATTRTALMAGPARPGHGPRTPGALRPVDWRTRRFPLRQTRITRGSREARPRWERRSGGPRSGTAGQGTCSTPSPAIPGRPRFQWSSPLERSQWSSPLEASRRTGRPAPGRTCGGRTHSPAGALAPPRAAPSPRERYLLTVRTVLVRHENGLARPRAPGWRRDRDEPRSPGRSQELPPLGRRGCTAGM